MYGLNKLNQFCLQIDEMVEMVHCSGLTFLQRIYVFRNINSEFI